MAKLSKDELLNKVNESELSEDAKISFMEDIADSFDNPDTTELDSTKAELETVKMELENAMAELEDLKNRYKERFLNLKDVVEEIVEDAPVMEEEEIIDVKDIFTEDEEKKEEE